MIVCVIKENIWINDRDYERKRLAVMSYGYRRKGKRVKVRKWGIDQWKRRKKKRKKDWREKWYMPIGKVKVTLNHKRSEEMKRKGNII